MDSGAKSRNPAPYRQAGQRPDRGFESTSGQRGGLAYRLGTGAAVLVVLTAYLWFVSLGTWTTWPQHYDYSHFDKLASAFRHGQLDLLESPSPALLALPNPFDPGARIEIPYVTDASLYEGRYYLYFGPVPALLLLVPKLFISKVIPDVYLMFTFVCAVFMVQTMLILRIRTRFFPAIPRWLVITGVLCLGLGMPFSWILGSSATVHNTAISAGQFFFLAGVWMAAEALASETMSRAKAVGAGIFWAAAIGSRITQAFAICLAMLLLFLLLFQRRHWEIKSWRWVQDVLPFAGPILLAILALAWYNWARFGSMLETGYSYQLAMPPLQQYRNDIFSRTYVLQNLFNYWMNPPEPRFVFPYVWPHVGFRESILDGSVLSPIYVTEENSGLIFVSPFLIFALGSIFGVRRRLSEPPNDASCWSVLTWLECALGVAFFSGLAALLFFFWASNRYLMDFLPPALLLSVIGFWHTCEFFGDRAWAKRATIAAGVVLMAVSVLMTSLLAISQNAGPFSDLNAGSWKDLNHVMRHAEWWQLVVRLYRLKVAGSE